MYFIITLICLLLFVYVFPKFIFEPYTQPQKISTILFQKSKGYQEPYVVDMIKNNLPSNWTYIHFNDDQAIDFMTTNTHPEFPDIIKKFHSIHKGAHKADLFRYYFLYLKGGVFMDSDAMLETNIENVVKDYSFFTVRSIHPNSVFQGFIGSEPGNEIIHKALKNAYTIDVEELNRNYLLLTRNLFDIIQKTKPNFSMKLYKEERNNNESYKTLDDDGKVLVIHYNKYKIIPKKTIVENYTDTSSISKILFQTSKEPEKQYVADMFKNYLPDDWAYHHFTDEGVIEFMKNNPCDEFPNIIDKFKNIKSGPHKADLFRYYFLYLKGGVFVDSDAMLDTNIENVVKDFSFFTVYSVTKNTMFQGFIGASPYNKIIHSALVDAYNTKPEDIEKTYHIFTKKLYELIHDSSHNMKIKLFREQRINSDSFKIMDDKGNSLLIHYNRLKVIPEK